MLPKLAIFIKGELISARFITQFSNNMQTYFYVINIYFCEIYLLRKINII